MPERTTLDGNDIEYRKEHSVALWVLRFLFGRSRASIARILAANQVRSGGPSYHDGLGAVEI